MTLHPDDTHDLRREAAADAASDRHSRAVVTVLRGGRTPGGDTLAEVLASFEYENRTAHAAFVTFVSDYISEEAKAA
jgi:hypothetical protein